MHPVVPIIMTLGVVIFLTGTLVFAVLGVKQINVVRILGKEYKLWRFVIVTIGLGVLLFMSSIFIHKNVPYEPESQKTAESIVTNNLPYELELLLSDIKSSALVSDIKRFQQEYQAAIQEEDKNTIELLSLEMEFRLRTELEKEGHTASQIEQEVKRIMDYLKKTSGK